MIITMSGSVFNKTQFINRLKEIEVCFIEQKYDKSTLSTSSGI